MNNLFLNRIASKFQSIHEKFQLNMIKLGLVFDEDIFVDTLLKCNDKLVKEGLCDKDIISYFWIAFKNNTLREFKYLRNQTTDEIPETLFDDSDGSTDLFDEVTKLIIDKFGVEMYQLFVLHANGTSYDELYKITKMDKLKYKFRRIREYVKSKY